MNASPLVLKMLLLITKKIQKDLFREERGPRDKEEAEAVADTFAKVIRCFQLLKFDKVDYPKRDWFLYSRVPVKLMTGANQIGKTTTSLADAISWCLGEYIWSGKPVLDLLGNPIKPPVRVLIGAESFATAHAEVIVPKLNELIPMDYLGIETDKLQGRMPHKIRFPKELGGSSIKLMAYNQEPSEWEGHTWHRIVFDEPPPEYAFVATQRGAMRHRAITSFSLTPLKEPWIFDKVYSSDKAVHVATQADANRLTAQNYAVINADLDDTPYLSAEAKADFISKLDEEQREARQHGRWTHLMGRVYKKFDRGIHVLPGDWGEYKKGAVGEKWPCGMVVDPHDRKPWAISWFVCTPRDEIVWIAEWPDFDFHATKQWNWSTDQYAEKIKEIENELGIHERMVWRLMDPNFGRTQKAGTGATLEDEMLDRGLSFDTQIDDKVELGHIAVRDALADPARLFWVEKCLNGIRGMEHYTWSDYRVGDGRIKEKPQDQWKDFPDLSRYAVVYPVHYFDPGNGPVTKRWRNNGLG